MKVTKTIGAIEKHESQTCDIRINKKWDQKETKLENNQNKKEQEK